jgi:hypothetical protein
MSGGAADWRPDERQRDASLGVAAAVKRWAQGANEYSAGATGLSIALGELADALEGDSSAPDRMQQLVATLRGTAKGVEDQAAGQRNAFLALHALVERMERLGA